MILDTGYPSDPVTYVYPGGVVSLATAGGRFLVRCGLDWLYCPQTGLVAELDRVAGLVIDPDPYDRAAPFKLVRGRDPVPWRSMALRDAALADLEARLELDDGLRWELVRHVRSSPFYEGI
jgi:hypothetical protein